MFTKIKVDQVKKLIINALDYFAKELKQPIEKVCLLIYTIDGTPKLLVLNEIENRFKNYKSIGFGDLCSEGQKLFYKTFNFDVEEDTPVWIQKFLVKSAKDHQVSIEIPKYMLIVTKKELKAFMYVNNVREKEISIEYILETR